MRARQDTANVQLKIRIKEPLRAKIERDAEERGISMNAAVEDRLDQAYRDAEAFGARGGLVRFLLDLIRVGAGSRALTTALTQVEIPGARSDPENFAKSTIFDAGFDDIEHDPVRATEASRWRDRYGPEIAGQLVSAYHRLREEIELQPDRQPPAAAVKIAAGWDAILRPIAVEADERLRAILEDRLRRRLTRLMAEKKD
jgi:hypothetical protein